MTFLTADPHGNLSYIEDFLKDFSEPQTITILGDAGFNYYLDSRDRRMKQRAADLSPHTFFIIHGNHEERPVNISGMTISRCFDAPVYIEPDYPNIVYAIDGWIYNFPEGSAVVIGGAYSVDKHYRLTKGWSWFESEQPTQDEKNMILFMLDIQGSKSDFVLTHTCPTKYEPIEWFLPQIDQSGVDSSVNDFLDEVEEMMEYKKWYCGHYHGEKVIDKIRFVHHSFVELGR